MARPPTEDAPLAAPAFKTASDPHLGRLTFVRLYPGSLSTGERVYNPLRGAKERIGKIYRMHAAAREEVADGTVAVMGLHRTGTGETLCDAADPIVLDPIGLPRPRHRGRGPGPTRCCWNR